MSLVTVQLRAATPHVALEDDFDLVAFDQGPRPCADFGNQAFITSFDKFGNDDTLMVCEASFRRVLRFDVNAPSILQYQNISSDSKAISCSATARPISAGLDGLREGPPLGAFADHNS
jgi:hypothetical protein